jgi:ubiquinone/menaquinone biosynthesis C-methylase UbiE
MSQRVCPWWLGYFLASPIRRLWQDPARILAPYVCEGMTVLEPGPGMGFFTLELARRVGPGGRVVAIDVQSKMLEVLKRRTARAGLLDRVDARVASADSLGVADLAGKIDLVLAFAVVHELPSAAAFFQESAQVLRKGGSLLLAEPRGHVSEEEFGKQLELARMAGLTPAERPVIRSCWAALLQKAIER